MSVKLDDNVVRWSGAFLDRFPETAGRQGQEPPGLTLGYSPSHDAGELVVTARDNRLEAPAGRRVATPLLIHAAEYNSQRVLNRRLSFSSSVNDAQGTAREARKKPASRSR
jgi:hypothetical protein